MSIDNRAIDNRAIDSRAIDSRAMQRLSPCWSSLEQKWNERPHEHIHSSNGAILRLIAQTNAAPLTLLELREHFKTGALIIEQLIIEQLLVEQLTVEQLIVEKLTVEQLIVEQLTVEQLTV